MVVPALASDEICADMSSKPSMRDGSRSAAGHANRSAAANVRSDSIQRLVVLGYITAVAMPPVGFILGLLLALRLTKPNSKRGIWIVVVSVIAAAAWILALATGLLNPNSTASS
jgi:hypothetical protein